MKQKSTLYLHVMCVCVCVALPLLALDLNWALASKLFSLECSQVGELANCQDGHLTF